MLSPEMKTVAFRHKPKLLRDITETTRLVHDLGISGDDWDDFSEDLVRAYGWKFEIDEIFIPSELSADSLNVSRANGVFAAWFPRLRQYYIGRIRCPPLTLAQLHLTYHEF